MHKRIKKIIKIADSIKARYSVIKFTIDEDHDHPIAICEMTGGSVVRVNGLPSTSGTDDKHVAQNALKQARTAFSQGLEICSYRGGK